MKKYDEFGRPIYETAEEYNQAHRNAQHMHTYETLNDCKDMHKTASQRYQKPRVTNGKNPVAVFVIICVLVASMFAGIMGSVFSMVDDSYSYYEEEEGIIEYYGDDQAPLPDGFETFSLDGNTYSLPTHFEDFQNLGYACDMEYDIDEMMPSEFDESIEYFDEDGSLIVMVSINNMTDEEVPLGKCVVEYFYIENPAIFYEDLSTPDFVFGDGLTFESSYEELEAYFGEPYYHYEDHTEDDYYYDSYEWAYHGEEAIHYVNVTFWNGEISDIRIHKMVW